MPALIQIMAWCHDDVIKWKHFPRYWPFVRRIHRSPVNSPHKGQWRGALMFSLICIWINGWVNNCEADDLRCYRAHYDVTVMAKQATSHYLKQWWNVFLVHMYMCHSVSMSYYIEAEWRYIGVGKKGIIWSDDGMSPAEHHWAITGSLSVEPLGGVGGVGGVGGWWGGWVGNCC